MLRCSCYTSKNVLSKKKKIMEISSIIYGLLILLACLSPFFIIALIKSNKTNKEIKDFVNHGYKYSIELTDVDKWPNHFIGMDPLKKKILYIEKYGDQYEEILLDLNDYKSCEMIRKDVGSGQNSSIDRIQLNFMSKKSGSTTLVFYDSEKNSAMYFELGLGKNGAILLMTLLKVKCHNKQILIK